MADPKEAFPVLVDENAEGCEIRKMVEGDSAAAKNGLLGFSFKDADGNAVLPQLDEQGKLPVVLDSGTQKHGKGELAAGSLTLASVTGAEVTLTADKKVNGISLLCSCRRDSLFQLVQLNDAAETVVAEVVLGPGQYSFEYRPPQLEVTAGATGTQKLLVKGMNFDKESSLRATISCCELP